MKREERGTALLLKAKAATGAFQFMLEEVQGAVRPNSQVLVQAVPGTKQLTVVVVVTKPTGMYCFFNY